MDKIQKFLEKKLDKRYRSAVFEAVDKILKGELEGLNITTLKKHPGHFRVRVGRVRIKFYMSDSEIRLLDISYRDDNTYRGY